jgi:tRNA threonylcarbamoyladenosine biosynthesis protein TsaB
VNPSSPRRLILAVDTTGNPGSIALVAEDSGSAYQVIEEVQLDSPEGFGQVLFGEIDALLARAGAGVRDLAAFASASGPGSFTGVRIGLAAAKGLGEATGRPVIAVSNLQALAFYGSALLRAVVMDARRGEVYGAVYNSDLELVEDEVVSRLDAWLASLPKPAAADVEFVIPTIVSEADRRIAEALSQWRPAHPADPVYKVAQAPRAMAGAIGKIALDRFRHPSRMGLALDAAEIDANYVRRSDAEMAWSDPHAVRLTSLSENSTRPLDGGNPFRQPVS